MKAAASDESPMSNLHPFITATVNTLHEDLQVTAGWFRQRWWLKFGGTKGPLFDTPDGSPLGIGALCVMHLCHPVSIRVVVDDTLFGWDHRQDGLQREQADGTSVGETKPAVANEKSCS